MKPVPAGSFAATGHWVIPQEYAKQIPSIAYTVPDLDGQSKVELQSTSGPDKGKNIACYTTTVTNNKEFHLAVVSWAAAAIAGAALIVSGLGAIAALIGGGHGTGTSTSSPTFTEVILYFQGIATTGMMSVQHPGVYRSWTQNFAFSTGLVHFGQMESSIDTFRAHTGGNLTDDSVKAIRNSTLIYAQPSSGGLTKRGLMGSLADTAMIMVRDNSLQTSINGSTSSVGGGNAGNGSDTSPKEQKLVTGIEGYVNAAAVPTGNTFMTALLIFSIILAAITAGILLFKVILEVWALMASFPKKLTSFRKNYWWLLAKTITNLILLLYGTWTLYCIYQFRQGDSWAAKVLAGVTLGLFTVILVGFTVKIVIMTRKFKKAEGDTSGLYEDKEVWRKYSIFYDNFKRGYWWLFIPTIIYMFLKGCVIAGADGKTSNHSLAQTAGLLIVDSLMLVLLLFLRPYNLKSGNWINIVIQVVRVISVVCILIFVEKLGFSQTTKTATGVVLIVVQASLTGVLGILIAINAIVNCCRMNPHRKARKEAGKCSSKPQYSSPYVLIQYTEKARDLDTLTPLDAHNSLLMYPMDGKNGVRSEVLSVHARGRSQQGYDMLPLRDESKDRLISQDHERSMSREPSLPQLYSDNSYRSPSPALGFRQPQLPDLDHRPTPGMAL